MIYFEIKKLAILFLILAQIKAGAQIIFQHTQNVSKVMDEAVKDCEIPALVALAVNNQQQEITYSHGMSVWDKCDSISTKSIFRIYSMTKLLTSIAIMQLVERDMIELDEDLFGQIPEMSKIPILKNGKLFDPTKAITLRHLLTHTSGFGFELTDAELAKFNNVNWNHPDLPRRFESGTQFLYGTSTDWVGRLVEKLSGVNLETYFRKNITGPLGMSRTWYNVPDSLKENIVSRGWRGHDGRQPLMEIPSRIPTKIVKVFKGSSGLFSSPEDYGLLLRCLLNKGCWNGIQILADGTVDEMITNQIGDIRLDISKNFYAPGSCCNLNGIITRNDKWGLAWLIDFDSTYYGRKPGTVLWGGLLNTHFYIDYQSGVAAAIFTQHLPFNHPETTHLFDRFSRFIYTGY